MSFVSQTVAGLSQARREDPSIPPRQHCSHQHAHRFQLRRKNSLPEWDPPRTACPQKQSPRQYHNWWETITDSRRVTITLVSQLGVPSHSSRMDAHNSTRTGQASWIRPPCMLRGFCETVGGPCTNPIDVCIGVKLRLLLEKINVVLDGPSITPEWRMFILRFLRCASMTNLLISRSSR